MSDEISALLRLMVFGWTLAFSLLVLACNMVFRGLVGGVLELRDWTTEEEKGL